MHFLRCCASKDLFLIVKSQEFKKEEKSQLCLISLYFQTEIAKIFYYRTGNKCRILSMH